MHNEVAPDIQTLVQRAQEVARKNGKKHGKFFRYTSVDNLHRLLENGELGTDSSIAYRNFVEGKFNPKKYSPEAMLSYYVIRAIQDYVQPVPEIKATQVLSSDPIGIIRELERKLLQKNSNYGGLVDAVTASTHERSTLPIIKYFKRIGGDWLMVKLERSGGATPNNAFSDLLPLSAGAPLVEVAGPQMVMLELDFDLDSLVIPDSLGIADNLSEHEVMTTRISKDNLRGVYWEGNFDVLRTRLEREYPEHFNGKSQNPYADFASEVPLSSILSTIAGSVANNHTRG